MPRCSLIGTERIDRHDRTTGLFVRQITSFPTVSVHMHYETPTFTPDGGRMIFASMRMPKRGAPSDLFVVGSDGRDPMQLSGDAPEGMHGACLATDGEHALYVEGGTLHRTRLADADDTEVGHMEGAVPSGGVKGTRSADGRYYFNDVRLGECVAVLRWNLLSGEQAIVCKAHTVGHLRTNPGGPEVSFNVTDSETGPRRPVNFHADTLEELTVTFPEGPHGTAHRFWLGRTGRIQATQLPPGRAVQIMDRDAEDVEIVAEGPYFWHSGASYDGKWIVADTNWPDEGIWLINAATKKRERLCFAGSSQGHPQFTHPHPNLSDDGSMAVFTSDRTGITQVYVAYVPDEMRRQLSTPD